MDIRRLTPQDWQIWKQLRLEALKNAPESFGSSYEEELRWSDLEFQNEINKSNIFGAFIDHPLKIHYNNQQTVWLWVVWEDNPYHWEAHIPQACCPYLKVKDFGCRDAM